MTTERSALGAKAEELACQFLKSSGYKVLDRNWRRPWGELDIVAKRSDTVHFIEVKASSIKIGGFEPYLRADRTKMHKVMRTARTWLLYNGYGPDTEWQMDIVSVILNQGSEPDIEIFEQI